MLQMTEMQFWRCTPRKLVALAIVHREMKQAEAGDPSTPKPSSDSIAGYTETGQPIYYADKI